MQLFQFNDAKECFNNALNIEVDNAQYHRALAATLIRLGEYEDAAEHAITAVELVKFFPEAHYILGEALEKMGDLENSKIAYEMAAKLTAKTHKKVEMAIENVERKKELDLTNKSDYKYYDNQIVIVSGLPRSGTSLMMQMLDKGGMNSLTDNLREADDSNPKGYFEYEPVMKLHKDNSWLGLAENKSVKVVAPLLKFLPGKYRYKVIFMNRDINEIVKSQQKMIGKDTSTLPIHLIDAFHQQLEIVNSWKEREPGVELIYMDYKDVLYSPEKSIKEVKRFIGQDLDETKMASCIDTSLYRNKV